MNRVIKTGLACVAILSAAAMTTPAFAADEANVAPGLTYAGAPLGLHGVDPVALIGKGKPVEGVADFTGTHDGVAYYFASKENLETFNADPAKFVPQNGGFCTFGVSVGKKFDGDPQFAAVVGDKLYVFLNEAIFNEFNKDRSGTISKAEANWTKIKHTAATDL
ncbi:MAG: YHS domain-containing (seleno)protein [Pseudomonadota bacterium]